MDNNLYAISCKTGKELWRFATGKYGNSSIPAIHNDVLYHGSRDGFLYALTLNGKEIWRLRTDGGITGSNPVIVNDKIYFCDENGNIYAVNLEGDVTWKQKIEDVSWCTPAIYGNQIFFCSVDCHMYSFDVDTGKEIWRFASSNLSKSYIPPAFDIFEATVKKQHSQDDEANADGKYDFSRAEVTGGSEYHFKSDYQFKSEYQQKSDYK